MINKIMNTINKNSMFQDGDKVIVGVSGGPDSMSLLNVLNTMKKELNISLVAAHINHCLRGEEADKDEELVKKFCKQMDIEFFSKRIDINRLAKELSISCEMAGREARYKFFEEIKEYTGAQKIALAHNANDVAETILMRIMRGTGIEGLVGIKPIRDEIFVRPLIEITRDEIERYCEENNVPTRIDKSNLESIYTRNKVRLELIPYIKTNFNSDIINILNRLAHTVKEDNDCLEGIATKLYKKYSYIKDNKVIIYKEAFSEHEAIITRIIRNAIIDVKGSLYNLEKVHIYDIINLQEKSTGKRINLPQGIVVANEYGNIEIKIKDKIKENMVKEYVLNVGHNNINELNIEVDIKNMTLAQISKDNFNKNDYVKYFDVDKIGNNAILLRYRKNGDRFVPFGMKGKKKIKDLFIDLKVPQDKRDRVPLICFGEEIAWIVGYRIGEDFKIDENTKNILEIRINKEEK